jgi:hypothetical protein
MADETDVAPTTSAHGEIAPDIDFGQSTSRTTIDAVANKHERAFRELTFANVLAR